MVEKYYEGIIEQVYGRIGGHAGNMTLARYSNDFSIEDLTIPQRVRDQKDVFVWSYEFDPSEMSGPYEPFLDLIFAMFEEQGGQNFDEFLEENDIYYLHRQMLRSYRKGGFCRREEGLILGEIEYEQECMTEGILRMLLSLSEKKPCLIILNRIQLAAGTTLTLLDRLLEEENAQALNVQNLKQVCLLGAYVKRRVNLALICDQKTVVPVDELAHCIRESLTYLTQYGAVCALHQEGRGSVSNREAQTAYDFFEDCLEAALPSLSALMVRLECGERFSIRLMLEDAAGLPNVDQYRTLGKLTIDDADGALCATLSFDRGGERA